MTNIEKIKQARQELHTILKELGIRAQKGQRISKLQFDAMQVLFEDFACAQAEALRQATEVADENFARAQKLSEQVQENVRHIERLAERRSDENLRIVDGLTTIQEVFKAYIASGNTMPWETIGNLDDKLTIALALAKGEAV